MAVPGNMAWGDEFVQMFHRECFLSWHAYFELASDEELRSELKWAVSRSESPVDNVTDETTFEDVLNYWEFYNVQKYEELLGGDRFAVQLHQDAGVVPTHNANMGRNIHTIIKNCWPCWSQVHKRWMSPMETFACHQYPVFTSIHGETCSFNQSRESHNLPPRKRNIMFEQAGNGMMLSCVGLALLWFHLFARQAKAGDASMIKSSRERLMRLAHAHASFGRKLSSPTIQIPTKRRLLVKTSSTCSATDAFARDDVRPVEPPVDDVRPADVETSPESSI